MTISPASRAKATSFLVESEVDDFGGGVGRIADHQHLGPWHGVAHRLFEPVEEIGAGDGGDRADRGAGDDEAEMVDRVADGLGVSTTSPGAVIAWARLARPSLLPRVTMTSLSGSSATLKRRW